MSANERRKNMLRELMSKKQPIKGCELAIKFNVTRQVIVKDISLLRAEGNCIIATPDGYILNSNYNDRIKEILEVYHNEEDTLKELEIVVKYGGVIEDVVIKHPFYGEIKCLLNIKNLNDLNKFANAFNASSAKPISTLTNGRHIHTISTDSEENMKYIKDELKENGFIL